MDSKIRGYLGLAARIRKIETGERALHSIQNQKAKCCILAEDCGENAKKKIRDKCAFYKTELVLVNSREELSLALGKANSPYVTITDDGIAKQILKRNKEVI